MHCPDTPKYPPRIASRPSLSPEFPSLSSPLAEFTCRVRQVSTIHRRDTKVIGELACCRTLLLMRRHNAGPAGIGTSLACLVRKLKIIRRPICGICKLTDHRYEVQQCNSSPSCS